MIAYLHLREHCTRAAGGTALPGGRRFLSSFPLNPGGTYRIAGTMQTAVVLSTFHENVGDDLIRLGCEHLLARLSPGPWRYRHWAKSNALGASLPIGPLSTTSIHRRGAIVQAVLRRVERASMGPYNPWRFRRLLASDLIILCGTPLYYFAPGHDFAGTETWPGILLEAARSGRAPPIVTLGCGSIIPAGVKSLHNTNPAALDLVRDVVAIQSLVVCRDEPTRRLIRSAGVPESNSLTVLPCPSAWAVDRLGIRRVPAAAAERTICVSFSLESSGWSEDSERDEAVRIELLSGALAGIERRGFRAVVLAHNELDVAAFERVKRSRRDLASLCVTRVNAAGLLEQLGKARGLVTWRVHGAVSARSLGIPALLFQTDSRAPMAETLNAIVVDNAVTSGPAVESFLETCVGDPPPRDHEPLVALKEKAVEQLQASWAEHVAPKLAHGRFAET